MAALRLRNRTALVTGSSSGLGRSIALALAAEGANLCLADLYPQPRTRSSPETGNADSYHVRESDAASTLEALHALYGPDRVVFITTDVTSSTSVEAAVAGCVQKFGRLDIMCNNAGISVESTHTTGVRIHELDEREWDLTMQVNIKGVFLGCKYALQQMLRQQPLDGTNSKGWIVNTASIQSLVAFYCSPAMELNTAAYTTSKGAVAQLTKQIAVDYATDRIHCNAISPGFLRTAMTQTWQNNPVSKADLDERHILGGMGDPDDVAKAVVFLASDDVKWITGVNLPVDGGYTIL